MSTPAAFVAEYSTADRPKIDFAWNGKHASEFVDANQQIRWDVVSCCLDTPGAASAELLEHLFLADAAWTREAWGSPPHFAALATTLLQRGGEAALETFIAGLHASFDTFGACHQMKLTPELAARLAVVARDRAATAVDEESRERLVGAAELFLKVQKGTSQEGWATLTPGTPVYDVRVVSPQWYHKLWTKVSAMVKRET